MGVNTQSLAKQKYKAEKRSYFWRGVGIAIFSGMLYGLYTAFITRGMAVGIWGEWYGDEVFAASYVGIYVLGCIGCAVNDTMGAITMMIMAAIRGCLGDVFRCFKTRPGLLMVGVAMIGGPIANTAYVIGLTMAGPICAAITSLCAAIGAIIGRIFLKQELNFRMIVGIIICFAAGLVLSGTTFDVENMTAFFGMLIAFIAALGWGIEGSLGGYGVCMMDSQIGITIREITSSLGNIIIVLFILALIGKAFGGGGHMNTAGAQMEITPEEAIEKIKKIAEKEL